MASTKLPIALVTLGTASAVGAFYAATRDIHASKVSSLSPTSLLHRFVGHQHVDVYETKLDEGQRVETLAQAFFRSPVFQVERAVLRLAGFGSISDEVIGTANFEVGDRVVVFRVVERAPGQVLFCWNDFMDVNGHTWLSVAEDGRTVQFGSTFDDETSWHPIALTFLKFVVLPLHLWYAQAVLASARHALRQKDKQ